MSSQLTLDDAFEPDGNPTVVDRPERVRFRDYHEHIRIQREEAANGS